LIARAHPVANFFLECGMSWDRSCRRDRRRHAVVLVLTLAGCTSWHTETVAPRELLSRSQPDQVRAALHDGRRVLVHRPVVRSDSVVSGDPADTARLALEDIESIALRRVDPAKTVGLVVGVVAVPAILCAATCEFGPNFAPFQAP
jgi:hypothetical protein